MENGKCTKGFPKECKPVTTIRDDKYPEYRRRRRHTFQTKSGITISDEFVVPYNPYLTLKYGAHINVEICNSILSVKYLYKYVLKGCDKLSMNLCRKIYCMKEEYNKKTILFC